MFEFIQAHSSDFIAACAVSLSAAANWRVVRAEKKAAKAEQALNRMNLLVESERKNACVAKLMLVVAQKTLLLQRYPGLIPNVAGELDRLRNNFDFLRGLKEQEDQARRLAETGSENLDVRQFHDTLTNIRRLTVRLEGDVENETRTYNEMVAASQQIA